MVSPPGHAPHGSIWHLYWKNVGKPFPKDDDSCPTVVFCSLPSFLNFSGVLGVSVWSPSYFTLLSWPGLLPSILVCAHAVLPLQPILMPVIPQYPVPSTYRTLFNGILHTEKTEKVYFFLFYKKANFNGTFGFSRVYWSLNICSPTWFCNTLLVFLIYFKIFPFLAGNCEIGNQVLSNVTEECVRQSSIHAAGPSLALP